MEMQITKSEFTTLQAYTHTIPYSPRKQPKAGAE
jgi:hypothetical protein